MIALDWSHTKELTTFDGKKVRVETKVALLKRLSKDGKGKESNVMLKSIFAVNSSSVILEQGCPMSLIYDLLLGGLTVHTISNRATQDYRVQRGIEKSDEADAKIIWELSQNGVKLTPVTLDDKTVQLHDLYHQYRRYQKARVAMQNMKKAHTRQYRGHGGESRYSVKSINNLQPPLDLMPYDIAIEALHGREKSLIKRIVTTMKGMPLFEVGGESNGIVSSTLRPQPPAIKGLGPRLWVGIIVTANPSIFKCLSAYLRYCGLTSDVIESHKYNRHARMLYHMLAESTMKLKNAEYRAIYDKCKEDITRNHPDYTKGHIHNAALNRTATFLAKTIYRAVKEE